MLIANICAIALTVVAVYGFITVMERKFNVAMDVARDLNTK